MGFADKKDCVRGCERHLGASDNIRGTLLTLLEEEGCEKRKEFWVREIVWVRETVFWGLSRSSKKNKVREAKVREAKIVTQKNGARGEGARGEGAVKKVREAEKGARGEGARGQTNTSVTIRVRETTRGARDDKRCERRDETTKGARDKGARIDCQILGARGENSLGA